MYNITSSKNPLIREIKALKSRKYRDENQLFIIEGMKLVDEALKEGEVFESLVMSERFVSSGSEGKILKRLEGSNCEKYTIPDRLFSEICDTETPQGVLAVLKTRSCSLEELLGLGDYFLLLDSVQDPGNLGTIIRTADAAGFTGVVISRGCVDVYNPKVVRSTMGSLFHIPFCFTDNPVETVKIFKINGVRVIAAHLKGDVNCFSMEKSSRAAVIIGNESKGISEELALYADRLVRIPMLGKAESLNASVAAGVLMYEVLKWRICN